MAKKISNLSVALGATAGPFIAAFRGAGQAVTGLRAQVASAAGTLARFTGIGAAVGAAFGALRGAASGIGLAASLEQTGVAFETMLGSAEAAAGLMQGLQKFSASTPFEFPEIAGASKKLLAFGIGADQMVGKLTMLGDIAAGVGAPLEDIAAIYGKIKSRGKLTGESLNQLAERGIPIYSALAAQLGVAESEIAGLVTAGRIGFGDVDAALAGLTATGGRFSGMMAKQSQTLAGLWSTLTDTIGLNLAGLVRSIVEAFRLKDAMAGLTTFLGTAGAWLNAAVATYAPLIMSAGQSIIGAAVAIFARIRAAVAPILQGLGEYIAQTWRQGLTTAATYGAALWSVVSGRGLAIWGIFQTVAGALSTAWAWAMRQLGLEAQAGAEQTAGAWQTLASWGRWLADTVSVALMTIGWGLRNFQSLAEYVGLSAAAALVKLGNQIGHVFTVAAPAYLQWFASNFTAIMRDIFAYGWTVANNYAGNLARIFANLPGLIRGSVSLSDLWTPLTEGFTATAEALPEIAERIPGALEQALERDAAAMGQALGQGLGEYIAGQEAAAKAAADAVAGAVAALPMPTLETPAAPEIPPLVTKVQNEDADAALEQTAKLAEQTAAAFELVEAGSARAMQLAAVAAFEALAAADERPKAAAEAIGSAAGAVYAAASTPSAAQAPAAARAAARAATDSAAAGKPDELAALVRKILDAIRDMPRIELAEVGAA